MLHALWLRNKQFASHTYGRLLQHVSAESLPRVRILGHSDNFMCFRVSRCRADVGRCRQQRVEPVAELASDGAFLFVDLES